MHFHEAQRYDKAWTYCRQAGDRAKRIFANVDAARFYERAATAGRRLRHVTASDLAAVYEALGDVRYLLGEHRRADDAFKAARRLLGPGSADLGRLALKQAKLSTRQGRYQTALRRVTRALKSLERVPGDDAAGHRAFLYVWYGWIRFNQDRPQETILWCRRGEQEALKAGARDALAQAYQFLDPAFDESGQIEQAVYSARALEIYEELGDLWQQAITLNNMGVTAKALSRWNDSRSSTIGRSDSSKRPATGRWEALPSTTSPSSYPIKGSTTKRSRFYEMCSASGVRRERKPTLQKPSASWASS